MEQFYHLLIKWLHVKWPAACVLPQAVELIKGLAEANMDSIDNATTDDIIKVYQLMRVIPSEGLESMWKQFADDPKYRWGSVENPRIWTFLTQMKMRTLTSIYKW